MRQNDAIFAGELSGHYYFKANSTAESSSMATFALANIVSASDKPLSELIAPLKKYSQSGEINTKTVTPPAEILAKIGDDPRISFARASRTLGGWRVTAQDKRGNCSYTVFFDDNPAAVALQFWLEIKGRIS